MKHRYLIVLALLAATLACPACYTLMRHPRVAQLKYARPGSDQSCGTCHDGMQIRAFNHPPHLRSGTGAWATYYETNWFRQRATGDSTLAPGRSAR
jgi:hypothetical protein